MNQGDSQCYHSVTLTLDEKVLLEQTTQWQKGFILGHRPYIIPGCRCICWYNASTCMSAIFSAYAAPLTSFIKFIKSHSHHLNSQLSFYSIKPASSVTPILNIKLFAACCSHLWLRYYVLKIYFFSCIVFCLSFTLHWLNLTTAVSKELDFQMQF